MFKRKYFPALFTIILIIFSATASLAQSTDEPKMTKKQKKAHEKKEQQKQDAKKAEIEGRKQHMMLQDKQTRKRMKRHRRQGSGYVSRNPGFWGRLRKSKSL